MSLVNQLVNLASPSLASLLLPKCILLTPSFMDRIDQPEAKFSLYFLAFDSSSSDSHGKPWTAREGLLELTHNYGTEDDLDYKINNGNGEEHEDMFSAPWKSF